MKIKTPNNKKNKIALRKIFTSLNKLEIIVKKFFFLMKNNFLLNFSSPDHERLYNEYFSHVKLRKMGVLLSIENIFVILLQTYFLISYGVFYLEYLFLCLGLILLILLYVIIKFHSRLLFFFVNLNFVALIVYHVELMKYFKDFWPDSRNLFIIALPFQMLFLLMYSFRINWLICSLTYFLSIIYLFFRVGSVDLDTKPKISTIILVVLLCWLMYTIIVYDHERTFKKFFAEKEENFQKASYFKYILQDVMPSTVLIVDYEHSKINFVNHAGIELFGLKEKTHSEKFQIFESFLEKSTIIQNKPYEIHEINEETHSEHHEISLKPLDFIKGFMEDPMETPLQFKQNNENINISSFKTINISTESPLVKSMNNFEIKNDVFTESNKHYYEVKIIKIFYENSLCIMINLTDNTHFFRMLELLSLNQYKNQLLASVSHDLRTPLIGVDGMLELSIEKTHDEIVLSYLQKARISTNFLRYLINDILDFSLMNFKKLRLNIEKIDFERILEEVKNLFDFQASAKNIAIRVTCLLSNTQQIFSDSVRIKQILLNLVSNSLKFTQYGFIDIIVEEVIEFQKVFIRVSVKDTGCGIKTTDLKKLFHLFGKLDDFHCVNKTGIGLGLTISKKISKLLCPCKPNGLEVESVLGKGSTFSFFVSSLNGNFSENNDDCNDNIDEKIMKKQISPCEKYHSLHDLEEKSSLLMKKKKKIMVVDDDLFNLAIIEGYLKFFNYNCEKAINGREAYKLIKNCVKNKKCDVFLILMDCNMPVLDGFQASVKINKCLRKYHCKKIPILAMTANVTLNHKKLCDESGIDLILEKPLKRSELKEIIEEFSKKKL